MNKRGRITLRCSRALEEAIESNAKAQNLSVSSYVRKILLQHHNITPDMEDTYIDNQDTQEEYLAELLTEL